MAPTIVTFVCAVMALLPLLMGVVGTIYVSRVGAVLVAPIFALHPCVIWGGGVVYVGRL